MKPQPPMYIVAAHSPYSCGPHSWRFVRETPRIRCALSTSFWRLWPLESRPIVPLRAVRRARPLLDCCLVPTIPCSRAVMPSDRPLVVFFIAVTLLLAAAPSFVQAARIPTTTTVLTVTAAAMVTTAAVALSTAMQMDVAIKVPPVAEIEAAAPLGRHAVVMEDVVVRIPTALLSMAKSDAAPTAKTVSLDTTRVSIRVTRNARTIITAVLLDRLVAGTPRELSSAALRAVVPSSSLQVVWLQAPR
ncbi:hypothetical protein HGRIS_010059 [Hohenbuehelia grisea]|uniref:Antifreeze protein n=1 Tax=Hohenbuehelia grisea TaxID=104357 RepID=A0ABR3J3P3_9AGAR